jgi:hypothetical protein
MRDEYPVLPGPPSEPDRTPNAAATAAAPGVASLVEGIVAFTKGQCSLYLIGARGRAQRKA